MSEFLGLDLETLPHQVDERVGNVLVWYRGVLLATFPWHVHPHVGPSGDLHLLDLPSQRWIREFPAGTWSTVNRA